MHTFFTSFRTRRTRWLLLAIVVLLASTTHLSAWAFSNGQDITLAFGDAAINTAITAYTMTFPDDIVIDPAHGKVFVSDSTNHRILRFTTTAALINGASAEAVLGQPNLNTKGVNIGSVAADNLNRPLGITMDQQGRLWVADYANSRVLRFDDAANKANGAPADGVLGQPDFNSKTQNNGGRSATSMSVPSDVYADAEGRLWVADSANSRVLRFDNAANKANGAPADGVLGQPNFTTGTINNGGISATSLNNPDELFFDATGYLWVADTSNHRVLRFDDAANKTNGAAANGVLGQPNFTSNTANNGGLSASSMYNPAGLSSDEEGRLWISDSGNGRVLRFDAAATKTNGAAADGVLGQPNFTSNASGVSKSALNGPSGLFIDTTGRLWVTDSDNSRILWFDVIANKANNAEANGVLGRADFITGTSAIPPLKYPTGIAVDPVSGKVFVSDTSNHRVLRYTSIDELSSTVMPEAVFGQPDVLGTTSNNGGISASTLYNPRGLAIDSDGNLWVADSLNYRALRFDNAANKPTGAAADGVLGQPNFASRQFNSGSITANTLGWLDSLVVDSAGRLWVSDEVNSRVLRFDDVANKSNGAAADGVLGQLDFVSSTQNNGGVSAHSLGYTAGVTVDTNGTLWVADAGNNRILRFDAAATKANGADADGVLGQSNFTSAQFTSTTASSLHVPWALSIDLAGQLWVADAGNNRVLRFDTAASKPDGAAADGVLGQKNFTNSYNSSSSAITLYSPEGVFADGNQRVWITNSGDFKPKVIVYDVGEPSIQVTGNQQPIPAGATTPSSDDATDFGVLPLSTTRDHTFTIHNPGAGPLTLSGTPKVSVGGVDAADFVVTQQPSSPVNRDGQVSFRVRFTPSALGLRQATLTITSDASATPAYQFAIHGTALVPELALELALSADTSSVQPGAALTYDLALQNTTSGIAAVAATGVTLHVALPSTASAPACAVLAPATGSCGPHADGVAFSLSSAIAPGATQHLSLTLTVSPEAFGTLTTTATLSYTNALGDFFLPETASTTTTIAQVPQVISFPPPADAVYGDTPITLTLSSDAHLPVQLSSPSTSVCQVRGTTVTVLSAGTCILVAQQDGSARYLAATPITQTLTIAQRPLTVTALDHRRVVGQSNPPFTLSYSGFAAGDTPQDLDTPPVASTTATLQSPVGSYPITPSGGADANYRLAYQSGTLTITWLQQTFLPLALR